jgi:hypothetical protein
MAIVADSYYDSSPFDLAGGGMFQPLMEESRSRFTGGKKLSKAEAFKSGLEQNMTTKEALTYAGLFDNDDDDLAIIERMYDLTMDPERRRAVLDDKLEYDARRMAQAAPYNLMYQLPKTIMQSAAIPARLTLGGSTGIAQGLFNAIPSMRINPATPNAGRSYF